MMRKDRTPRPPVTYAGAPAELHHALDAVFTRVEEVQCTTMQKVARLVALVLVLVLVVTAAGVILGVAVAA